MITVTEAAKNRIIELLAEEKKDETYFLRVGVKGGGCSGLSYVLEFDNEEQELDETKFYFAISNIFTTFVIK